MKSLLLAIALSQTFQGYPCTEDCSGHEAGYEWAEENEIEDADDCSGGKSLSFIEGCEAWVEDNAPSVTWCEDIEDDEEREEEEANGDCEW